MSLPNLHERPLHKAILTAAIGETARRQASATRKPLASYAKRHGYDLVAQDEPVETMRPHAWTKVGLLRRLLYRYDLLVWVDADVQVVREDYDVGEVLTRTLGFQALAIEDIQINTGVWVVRGGDPMAAAFLSAVDAQSDLWADHPWDQAAVKRLLGYTDRSPGQLNLDWLRGTVLLPPEINDLSMSLPRAVLHHSKEVGLTHGGADGWPGRGALDDILEAQGER